MLWVFLALLALSVMAVLYQISLSPEERALIEQDRERRQRERRRAEAIPPPPSEDIMAQIERDPAATLARLGAPEDARALMAQGIDLEALGYRPPNEG